MSWYTEHQMNQAAHTLATIFLGPDGLHDTTPEIQKIYRAHARTILDALREPPGSMARRQITGALKDTIQAHGPITSELVGSAAKRIYSQQAACLNQVEHTRHHRSHILANLHTGS